MNVSKVLPLGTKVGIRLQRNRSEFMLIVDNTNAAHGQNVYAVKVSRIYVEALRLKLAADTISYLEAAISHQAARYFLTRTEIRYGIIFQLAASE